MSSNRARAGRRLGGIGRLQFTHDMSMTQTSLCSTLVFDDPVGLVTHLMDAVEPALVIGNGLSVGHPVQLRSRPDGRAVEAWSPRFGRLGSLPRDAGDAVAPLLGPGAPPLGGMVSALVPRPGRFGGTRIHIRLGGPG